MKQKSLSSAVNFVVEFYNRSILNSLCSFFFFFSKLVKFISETSQKHSQNAKERMPENTTPGIIDVMRFNRSRLHVLPCKYFLVNLYSYRLTFRPMAEEFLQYRLTLSRYHRRRLAKRAQLIPRVLFQRFRTLYTVT